MLSLWQHPGHGVRPLPAGGHLVRPAVSAGSLSLFRPTGGRGGPQIPVLCGLKGSGCRPSGLNGSVFHGGFWNMPGQDKHSHCGLFKMASCQPPHCRCIEWTPPSAHFSRNVYCRQERSEKWWKGRIMNLVNLACEYQLGELGNIRAVVESD